MGACQVIGCACSDHIRVPYSFEMCRDWDKMISRAGLEALVAGKDKLKKRRVCEPHFEDRMFERDSDGNYVVHHGVRKLIAGAVPTLNMGYPDGVVQARLVTCTQTCTQPSRPSSVSAKRKRDDSTAATVAAERDHFEELRGHQAKLVAELDSFRASETTFLERSPHLAGLTAPAQAKTKEEYDSERANARLMTLLNKARERAHATSTLCAPPTTTNVTHCCH